MTTVKTNETEKDTRFIIKGKTRIINGSVLMPEGSGLRLILVPCSESGKPESDLYSLLDTKWKSAKAELKGWHQLHSTFKQGVVKDVAVQSDVWLMNCLFLDKDGKINEKSLLSCLKEVCKVALNEKASVHISSLVIAAVPQLQDLATSMLVDKGVSVSFYQETTKPATK